MKIEYVDTDGTKSSLPEGYLGYDKATADRGRVAVGTNTGDVLLAKKSEVDTAVSELDAKKLNVQDASSLVASSSQSTAVAMAIVFGN